MYIKIIDSEGKEIGCIEKKYLAPLGLRHQIARVIAYARSTNTVLLQQRSLTDDSCPGMWDTSASGHVDGHEDIEVAALRELQEELNLTTKRENLQYVGSFETSEELQQGCLERQTHIYCLELEEESTDFAIEPDEVEKAEWVSVDDGSLELTKGAAKSLELLRSWLKEKKI